MKQFNTLFDIFLYTTIFSGLFSAGLFLLNDDSARPLIYLAVTSLVITLGLGFLGSRYKLFKEDRHGDFG
jgi:hypothetical protein